MSAEAKDGKFPHYVCQSKIKKGSETFETRCLDASVDIGLVSPVVDGLVLHAKNR